MFTCVLQFQSSQQTAACKWYRSNLNQKLWLVPLVSERSVCSAPLDVLDPRTGSGFWWKWRRVPNFALDENRFFCEVRISRRGKNDEPSRPNDYAGGFRANLQEEGGEWNFVALTLTLTRCFNADCRSNEGKMLQLGAYRNVFVGNIRNNQQPSKIGLVLARLCYHCWYKAVNYGIWPMQLAQVQNARRPYGTV